LSRLICNMLVYTSSNFLFWCSHDHVLSQKEKLASALHSACAVA
jgi:1,4-alpha-glucan branching enzyme